MAVGRLQRTHIFRAQRADIGEAPAAPTEGLAAKAFDANLIGIDPEYHIHITDELLAMTDGPMFEHGIKALAGKTIRLPGRSVDFPDKERLAERFANFKTR
jgi:putative restriction endonuclease